MIFKYAKCCGKTYMISKAQGKCKVCNGVLTLSENWYVRYTNQGKTRVKAISPRKQDAVDYLASVRLKIRSGLSLEDEKLLSWDDAVKQFRKWFELGHIRTGTQDFYGYCLIPLTEAFNTWNIQDITKADVMAYQADRLRSVKPSTINREIATLKRMIGLCCDWQGNAPRLKAVKEMLATVDMLKENNQKTRYLSESEAQKLLASCSKPYLRLMVFAGLMTGLRISNILNLTWKQIGADSITIEADEMKANKLLSIPLHPTLKAELTKWKVSNAFASAYVFPSPVGTPFKSVTTAFNIAVKKAGLKDVTPHTLRHTFASNWVMNGGGIEVLSRILGHADISITARRYLHLSQEHKQEQMVKFAMNLAL